MSSLPPPRFFVADLNGDDVDTEFELDDDNEDDNTVMEGDSDDDFEEPRGQHADARLQLLPAYAPAAAPFLAGGRAPAQQQLDHAYAIEWMQLQQAREFELELELELTRQAEAEATDSDDDEIVSE
jgi:hypothetical protein